MILHAYGRLNIICLLNAMRTLRSKILQCSYAHRIPWQSEENCGNSNSFPSFFFCWDSSMFICDMDFPLQLRLEPLVQAQILITAVLLKLHADGLGLATGSADCSVLQCNLLLTVNWTIWKWVLGECSFFRSGGCMYVFVCTFALHKKSHMYVYVHVQTVSIKPVYVYIHTHTCTHSVQSSLSFIKLWVILDVLYNEKSHELATEEKQSYGHIFHSYVIV